ncbi:MAG: hypothetical protein II755_11960, partial [Prevotella sp.]|nr:hypothetical protein [Prevotella sp.]
MKRKIREGQPAHSPGWWERGNFEKGRNKRTKRKAEDEEEGRGRRGGQRTKRKAEDDACAWNDTAS